MDRRPLPHRLAPRSPRGGLMLLCGLAVITRGVSAYLLSTPILIDLGTLQRLPLVPSFALVGWTIVAVGGIAIAGAYARSCSRLARLSLAILFSWSLLWTLTLLGTLLLAPQTPPTSWLPIIFWAFVAGVAQIAAKIGQARVE